jgi:hypothetical protein
MKRLLTALLVAGTALALCACTTLGPGTQSTSSGGETFNGVFSPG